MLPRNRHPESDNMRQRFGCTDTILRTLRNLNQLIVREKDSQSLAQQSCDLLTATGRYHRAWMVSRREMGGLRMAATSGFSGDSRSVVEELLRRESTACGRRALTMRGVHVIDASPGECGDCVLSCFSDSGWEMAVRLEHGGETFGYLSVLASAEPAEEEELAFFQEFSGDVAYALYNLSVEEAHARAVEALRESEARSRIHFEQSMDAILVNMPDGSIVEANPAALDLLGYSRDELLSVKTVDFYVNPQDREVFLQGMDGAESVRDEVRHKKKDGTVIDCRRTVIALKDESGAVTAYQGIIRDVTGQKRSERERLEKQKELECIHAVATAAEEKRGLDAFLSSVADALTMVWQYPEFASARLVVDGKEYLSDGYREGRWKQSAPIWVCGQECGSIQVAYSEHPHEAGEGLFLAEERRLLDAIAGRVGMAVERARTDEQLRLTGERLRLAMDAGEHGFWDWNLDTNEMFFSPHFYSMLGYENGELPMAHETWMRLMHPEDSESVVREVHRRLQNLESYEVEFRLQSKDGSWKWVSCRGKTFEIDGRGVAHRAAGTCSDITERKRSVQDLRESEERYRALFEQSMDAIYVGNVNGAILDVNHAWLDLLGYERKDLPSVNAVDFYVNPEDRDTFLHRMAETGFVRDVVRYKRKDGTEFDCQRRQVALKDEYGNTVAFQGLVRDVTARRQSLDKLRESEERYRSLFEQSMDAIYVTAPDGASIDANQAWLDLFGYTRDDLTDLNSASIYADAQQRDDFIRNVVEKGRVEDHVRLRRKDGTIMDCVRSVVVRKDELGNVVAFQGVIHDVSQETKVHDRLQEAFIDLVETASRAMESVDPYTVGHQHRVARLAELVGRRLGMSESSLQGLYIGALLHDIGKLSLPSTILTKPSVLSVPEWNLVRSHPLRSHDILVHANLPWPVAEMALDHHERLDGSGYPRGKTDEALSLEVRILGLCDVIEAMSSDRPYRPARMAREVISEIERGCGSKYDPGVVNAVLRVIEEGQFPLNDTDFNR